MPCILHPIAQAVIDWESPQDVELTDLLDWQNNDNNQALPQSWHNAISQHLVERQSRDLQVIGPVKKTTE